MKKLIMLEEVAHVSQGDFEKLSQISERKVPVDTRVTIRRSQRDRVCYNCRSTVKKGRMYADVVELRPGVASSHSLCISCEAESNNG